MFEDVMQTRAAICGTGLLLALIFLFAHLPLILLIVPVAILFIGIVADPEETHAVWYGMLNTIGIFELTSLTDAEQLNYAEKRHYFGFGEVGMAAILAGIFAVPVGIFLLGRAELTSVHRCGRSLPAAVRVPAEIDSAGNEGGRGCDHNRVWEERAGQESVLDPVCGNGRSRAGPGRGPGDGAADHQGDCGDGGIIRSMIPPPLLSFIPI